jgi:hypothetical protein
MPRVRRGLRRRRSECEIAPMCADRRDPADN